MEYVLITGATSGIGYEIAKIYARKQYALVLISSNEKHLAKAKSRLKQESDTLIYTFVQDLSCEGAAINIYQYMKSKKIPISILVNNAGYGLMGETQCIDFKEDMDMIKLNVENLVALCKLFIPQMIEQGNGKILNVASTGAFQPGPYTATYYASKAFVLSYTRAIRYELKSKGIIVSALCPGTTKTNFFHRAKSKTPIYAMSPKMVAKKAVSGLDRNKEIIIPGIGNHLMCFLPQKIKLYAVAKIKKCSLDIENK